MNYHKKKLDNENEYIYKLERFVFNDLLNINNPIILEFGVRHGISTRKFLDLCDKKNGKLFSIDVDDCSNLFSNVNWKFIHCRDDNFEFVEKIIPKEFDLIYLDSLHTAEHVEKILYYYYKKLKVGGYFIIDDISWLPYVKDNNRDIFYNEINNQETFERLLNIYFTNTKNFDLNFSFISSGLAKIYKLNDNDLNAKKIFQTRKFTVKNFFRKIFKRNKF